MERWGKISRIPSRIIIDTVIEAFGYDSVTAVVKKDFDEILKQVVDMTLEAQYGGSGFPWDIVETDEIPA